ncbi:AAA family ATPase [Oceanobacillus damuensis]|uniref:AAA family ATPase n=1 Tax=Oceanobacillus damuensis TaxID=937928 RepID=UPI0008325B49|nr:AAA family ATPase [Oceanobacillus damuensis]
MKKGKLPLVIAIAGVSGGGKTTIAKHLNERLHNSKTLYFDDYDFDGPDDIIEWVDNGANYDKWDLAPLIRDIEALLAEPLDYIVLDFPFAYKHSKISNLIDFAVYIDTPLDIAMARRVIRDFNNSSNESILIEMENYISDGRRGYLEMLKSIKPDSDIIVDGSLSVVKITDNIYEAISRR